MTIICNPDCKDRNVVDFKILRKKGMANSIIYMRDVMKVLLSLPASSLDLSSIYPLSSSCVLDVMTQTTVPPFESQVTSLTVLGICYLCPTQILLCQSHPLITHGLRSLWPVAPIASFWHWGFPMLQKMPWCLSDGLGLHYGMTPGTFLSSQGYALDRSEILIGSSSSVKRNSCFFS